MAIHGIYVKNKPKNKWHLVSVSMSAEEAIHKISEQKEIALSEGNEEVQVAVQIFDSVFWIPEYISEIKEQKPLFN